MTGVADYQRGYRQALADYTLGQRHTPSRWLRPRLYRDGYHDGWAASNDTRQPVTVEQTRGHVLEAFQRAEATQSEARQAVRKAEQALAQAQEVEKGAVSTVGRLVLLKEALT